VNILIILQESLLRTQIRQCIEEQAHIAFEAENAADAINLFQQHKIEGVFGGLELGDMDGIELLKMFKSLNHYLPFVAISSEVDKDKILHSLNLGACDYITYPIHNISIHNSLNRIIQLNKDWKFSLYCLDNSISESRTLEISNDFEYINQIVEFITRNLPSYGIVEEKKLFAIKMALVEALNNAIFHGNLEVASELKREGFAVFREEAERRRSLLPFRDRRVHIHYEISRNSVKYIVRDEGAGFDYSSLPDPTMSENLLKESGRGIMIIMNFMDEVFWNKRGNEITIVRYKKHGINPFRQNQISD
jgi:DNA-binding response OmpR family regulator